MSVYRKFDRLPSSDMYALRAKRETPAPSQATSPRGALPSEDHERLRKAAPASEPLARTLEWVASLPADVQPTALLRHYARIANVIAAIWRDQTVNHVWQAGIEAKPVRKLTFNLSGNYVRTTGAGEISGEPPTFGPLRWPLATGTVSYDFPPAGRLSIDLQRTYYIEQIMSGDNFSANLLNIRWTKEF